MSKHTKAGRSASLRRWAKAARRGLTMPGRVVILGGEANCGKSTVLRRVAHEAAIRGEVVLYVSGEDGGLNLRRRFREDGLDPSRVSLLDLRTWNDVSGAILDLKPDLVVVDAVQMIPYDAEFDAGSPETLAAIFRGSRGIDTIAHGEWQTSFVVSVNIGKREGMSGPISRIGMGHNVDALMVLSRIGDVLDLMPMRDRNGPLRITTGKLRSRHGLGEMARAILRPRLTRRRPAKPTSSPLKSILSTVLMGGLAAVGLSLFYKSIEAAAVAAAGESP